MISPSIQPLLDAALDWLSPRQCALCELPAAQPLCRDCFAELPRSRWRCRQCGAGIAVAGVCGRCLIAPPGFDSAVCGFDYAFPLDALLSGLKYRADLSYLPALLQLLSALAGQLSRARGALVPVPLHPHRERKRGFNQSLLMARYLACHSELQLAPDMLARKRNTAPQAALSGEAREDNMHDAFAVTGDIRGIRVWLFDDVLTTGATAESASRALLDAGAFSVSVVSLLRAVGGGADWRPDQAPL